MPATITPLQKPKQASRNLTQEIEEYARHNGHADLLREVIDGVVGT
jgi:hypothetical protein